MDGERLSAPVAAVVALGFGAVLAASASLGVALGWTEPYWVPEPVLILVLYILMGKRDRIRGKALGTALGVVAVIPVALVSPPAWVLTALGVVVFVVALTQAKTYWLMYGLYTFALVLLLSAPGGVGFEAEERGFQILVGVALLVLGWPSFTRSLRGYRSGSHNPNSPQPDPQNTEEPSRARLGERVVNATRPFGPVDFHIGPLGVVLKDVVHPGPPWRLEVSKPPVHSRTCPHSRLAMGDGSRPAPQSPVRGVVLSPRVRVRETSGFRKASLRRQAPASSDVGGRGGGTPRDPQHEHRHAWSEVTIGKGGHLGIGCRSVLGNPDRIKDSRVRGWSVYRAERRNRWQPVANGKAPQTAKTSQNRCRALHPLPLNLDGKEGVDGSSPSEGSRGCRMVPSDLRAVALRRRVGSADMETGWKRAESSALDVTT